MVHKQPRVKYHKFSLLAADSTWNWQPAPRLQAFCGLIVRFHWGPSPFLLEICLPATIMPSKVPRLFVLRSACRLALSCLHSPAGFPLTLSTQSPQGAKESGCCHVSIAPSACTPSQVMTVPGLSHNFPPKSEQVLGARRGRGVGAGTSSLWGQESFLGPEP